MFFMQTNRFGNIKVYMTDFFCLLDRFVIYDSWVAFDVAAVLAPGLHLARFSAFDVTTPLS